MTVEEDLVWKAFLNVQNLGKTVSDSVQLVAKRTEECSLANTNPTDDEAIISNIGIIMDGIKAFKAAVEELKQLNVKWTSQKAASDALPKNGHEALNNLLQKIYSEIVEREERQKELARQLDHLKTLSEVDLNELVNVSMRVALTDCAPSGWTMGAPLPPSNGPHRLPYPTEDLIRGSSLFQNQLTTLKEQMNDRDNVNINVSNPVDNQTELEHEQGHEDPDAQLLDLDLN